VARAGDRDRMRKRHAALIGIEQRHRRAGLVEA
jgi:hypothetical protein